MFVMIYKSVFTAAEMSAVAVVGADIVFLIADYFKAAAKTTTRVMQN